MKAMKLIGTVVAILMFISLVRFIFASNKDDAKISITEILTQLRQYENTTDEFLNTIQELRNYEPPANEDSNIFEAIIDGITAIFNYIILIIKILLAIVKIPIKFIITTWNTISVILGIG